MIFSMSQNVMAKFVEILTRKHIVDLIVVKSNLSPYVHICFYDGALFCYVYEEPSVSNFNEILKELEKDGS